MTGRTPSIAHGIEVITGLLANGDIRAAEVVFHIAVKDHGTDAVLPALGRSVNLPPGTVLYGPGRAIWRNPLRDDYAWRCGACPWTGNNYRTAQAARNAAGTHAAEHPEHPTVTHIQSRS
ncbi:hypothetical protein [Thermomonospora umbrina]|uniref:Uncharacterized protein n=1 Tax=Thermomonospora umbrina TaxID=111806 RepID=A0A3D9SWK2_9ACTN|nr:hypothetical protein [Thermomonospora umbrina]REF00330.1 hypothetical protein DFJ69_5862 [Thermomonospora umbrina]